MLLERQRRIEKLRNFHENFIKNGKSLIGKNFKKKPMKRLNIEL
jgi:hypothetical protein